MIYPSWVTGATYLYLCAALYLLPNLLYFSCQYGERCKFLHATQQAQQQKPNPFGFGVPNNGQSKAVADFGSKQNQYKVFLFLRPYDNRWLKLWLATLLF